MPKPKKKDTPFGTPINTPINTPDRASSAANSFSALQVDSDAEEDKSVDTINAEEPQIAIESDSEGQAQPMGHPVKDTQTMAIRSNNPVLTPEAIKQSKTGTSPIAEILPTDLECLKESIPIFGSDLAKSTGKLFSDSKSI